MFNESICGFSILNIDVICHIIGIAQNSAFVKVLDLSSMALTLSSPRPDGDILERLQVNHTLRNWMYFFAIIFITHIHVDCIYTCCSFIQENKNYRWFDRDYYEKDLTFTTIVNFIQGRITADFLSKSTDAHFVDLSIDLPWTVLFTQIGVL